MSRRPRNATGVKAVVNMDDADLVDFMHQLHGDVDKVLHGLALLVEDEAKRVAPIGNFENWKTHKHTPLYDTIKAKKSKFQNGGYIVKAAAPHAHLVEYGHAMVTHDGRTVGHVAAHPFLRLARNTVKARMDVILKGLWK